MQRTISWAGVLCLSWLAIPALVAQQAEAPLPAKVAAGSPQPAPPSPAVSFQEHLLATIPAESDKPAFGWAPAFSPDGTRVAYVAKYDGKEMVVAGSERGPSFRLAMFPAFSPDGKTVTYLAMRSAGPFAALNTAYLMINDKRVRLQEESFRPVSELLLPAFSPNGTRLAFPRKLAGREDAAVVRLGDKEYRMKEKEGGVAYLLPEGGPEFEEVGPVTFSPDGSRMAHWARERRKWFLVVGRNRGPEFEEMGRPVFSPDGQTVAYAAKEHKKYFVMVGDARGPEFEYVAEPVFSPDGRTVAYAAKEGKKYFVVVGGKREPEFEYAGEPVFSPDGSKVAYVAKEGKKYFVVVGSQRGPGFDDVGLPVFSPDGSKVAYPACDCKLYLRAWGGGLLFPYTDFKAEPHADGFAPKRPPGRVVRRLEAALARWFLREGKQFIVVGDKVGPPFDSVTQPVFSPDGSGVAFGALQGRELWWKVMEAR